MLVLTLGPCHSARADVQWHRPPFTIMNNSMHGSSRRWLATLELQVNMQPPHSMSHTVSRLMLRSTGPVCGII